MSHSTRFLSSIALCFAVAACGSDSTGPENPGEGGGSLTATISGKAFAPPALTTGANYANQILTIQASSTALPVTALSINVLNVAGPGTYQLNPNFAGTFGQIVITSGGATQLWSTALSPGSGSITISTLSDSRVAGTFNFTAQAASGGATGQKNVTSGTFDIPL